MAPNEAIKVLLEGLAVPDYARVDYFNNKQQESGYSAPVFVRFLIDAATYLINDLTRPRFDPTGNQRPPIDNLPISTLIGYFPQQGPTMLTIDHLQQLAAILQQLAGNMVKGIDKRITESNKAEKQPNPQTTKRELTDLTTIAIALIHAFTDEAITTDNRDKIATRYKKPDGTEYSAVKLYTSYMNLPPDRLRQNPTQTLFNHYLRCINWLNNRGLKPAQKAAESELRQLQDKMG